MSRHLIGLAFLVLLFISPAPASFAAGSPGVVVAIPIRSRWDGNKRTTRKRAISPSSSRSRFAANGDIMRGIFTGIMLAVARIAGETAPVLLLVFGNPFINNNPFEGAQASLPLYIYQQYSFSGGAEAAYDRAWSVCLSRSARPAALTSMKNLTIPSSFTLMSTNFPLRRDSLLISVIGS